VFWTEGGEAVSHITLPRAVGLHIRNSLRGIVNASDDDCGEEKCRECAPVRVMREALTALDAALAEPDAIARAVEAEREACARVCDPYTHGQWFAKAIRARGSK
jgi:hypothetical protein